MEKSNRLSGRVRHAAPASLASRLSSERKGAVTNGPVLRHKWTRVLVSRELPVLRGELSRDPRPTSSIHRQQAASIRLGPPQGSTPTAVVSSATRPPGLDDFFFGLAMLELQHQNGYHTYAQELVFDDVTMLK